MTNHKLDKEVEEVLKHYGIKGMRWDVIRTPEQIAAAKTGVGGEDTNGGVITDENDISAFDKISDKILDKMEDIGDAVSKKMSSISKSVKKKGFKLLEGMFGKAGSKQKSRWTQSKLPKKTQNEMKRYMNASPSERKRLLAGKSNRKKRPSLTKETSTTIITKIR